MVGKNNMKKLQNVCPRSNKQREALEIIFDLRGSRTLRLNFLCRKLLVLHTFEIYLKILGKDHLIRSAAIFVLPII